MIVAHPCDGSDDQGYQHDCPYSPQRCVAGSESVRQEQPLRGQEQDPCETEEDRSPRPEAITGIARVDGHEPSVLRLPPKRPSVAARVAVSRAAFETRREANYLRSLVSTIG